MDTTFLMVVYLKEIMLQVRMQLLKLKLVKLNLRTQQAST